MWLVVGLGNPGAKYAETRHNIGFMVVDQLARKAGVSFNTQFKAQVARSDFKSERVIFMKPQTFMNLSGESVQPAASFFKVPPEQIIVVHDDIDLDVGQLKFKLGGGHGGHNGLRDIDKRLGPNFLRVRAGVGRPQHKSAAVHSHVLGRFADSEIDEVRKLIDRSCDAVELMVGEGLKAAQNRFQVKKPKKKKPQKDPQAGQKAEAASKSPSSKVAAAEPAAIERAEKKKPERMNGLDGLRGLWDKARSKKS